MKKTLGGDRLHTGKKMQIEMHEWGKSTHDLGYVWRSTASAGTLIPFMKELALPGDTFDINLKCDVKTHPTLGPLFGSFKVQLDVFLAPIRLYQAQLHNNELGIGLNMNNVKLPLLELEAPDLTGAGLDDFFPDLDNAQINPSCILSYLGIRGIGLKQAAGNGIRRFNAVPFIAYWDIYKNYYANKQEGDGQVIKADMSGAISLDNLSKIEFTAPWLTANFVFPEMPNVTPKAFGYEVILTLFLDGVIELENIIFTRVDGTTVNGLEIGWVIEEDTGVYPGTMKIKYDADTWGATNWYGWRYRTVADPNNVEPTIEKFPLANIDEMRRLILTATSGVPFEVMGTSLTPYAWLRDELVSPELTLRAMMYSQEGLAIKTYNSDLFNNWLDKETIDGVNGINEITAIDVTSGELKMDSLILAKKVYDMLNRIAISDGTYQSWVDTVYTSKKFTGATTPMYMGGLIEDLVFEEVIAQSESSFNPEGAGTGSGKQPLGTLAGKGVMGNRNKGGTVVIHVDEPSYIMGIVSLTPKLDYSQGNDWDINLQTMDDLHKPALDQIGFQDLITEQMAWWDTWQDPTTNEWLQKSAGKQPAWMNYMTNVNKVRGNFAVRTNEQFMTLCRRYETYPFVAGELWGIKDLTTYINPVIYNNIFADTNLDAQNFWVQIGCDIKARRLISAKIIPNL